jgi:hypothetical protein
LAEVGPSMATMKGQGRLVPHTLRSAEVEKDSPLPRPSRVERADQEAGVAVAAQIPDSRQRRPELRARGRTPKDRARVGERPAARPVVDEDRARVLSRLIVLSRADGEVGKAVAVDVAQRGQGAAELFTALPSPERQGGRGLPLLRRKERAQPDAVGSATPSYAPTRRSP